MENTWYLIILFAVIILIILICGESEETFRGRGGRGGGRRGGGRRVGGGGRTRGGVGRRIGAGGGRTRGGVGRRIGGGGRPWRRRWRRHRPWRRYGRLGAPRWNYYSWPYYWGNSYYYPSLYYYGQSCGALGDGSSCGRYRPNCNAGRCGWGTTYCDPNYSYGGVCHGTGLLGYY